MMSFALSHPTAIVARSIEELQLYTRNTKNICIKAGCNLLTRTISLTAFPIFLTFELLFKQIPKTIFGNRVKFKKRLDKVAKFALGILCTPLAIYTPDAVSTLFLKSPRTNSVVKPFGVEEQYGKTVAKIHYPATLEELQILVQQAKKEKKQISLIGAGMSQGPQTVPQHDNAIVINTKKLNQIQFGPNNDTVKVQSGTTWEQIQIAANDRGKSIIVKQASDIFSVGGSIGINCHGWAHEYGAIASTVESLEIIDAEGDLRTLTPQDELFGCMFGTLGYFGIIVSTTLKITDNEYLHEKTTVVPLDAFIEEYKTKIKDNDIPLFGGRLTLDQLDGNPVREVFMTRYERDKNSISSSANVKTTPFMAEPKYGTRFQRLAFNAVGHFPPAAARKFISWFWSKEEEAMLSGRKLTRNEALHPPINVFNVFKHSKLHTQWLQEYFIKEENLANFLRFLGAQLKANDVRLINATIRPTPRDKISILPYAEQDRYAVVICFDQLKSKTDLEKTKKWIESVNQYLVADGDVYYQAYMPFATKEQFEQCYGKERIDAMRRLKQKYDPEDRFGNGHTVKYFD